jgi:hypothetical protein
MPFVFHSVNWLIFFFLSFLPSKFNFTIQCTEKLLQYWHLSPQFTVLEKLSLHNSFTTGINLCPILLLLKFSRCLKLFSTFMSFLTMYTDRILPTIVLVEYQLNFTRIPSIISQKIELFITTTMKTSIPIHLWALCNILTLTATAFTIFAKVSLHQSYSH